MASMHCVGMCAPLSCTLFRSCFARRMSSYHLARTVSYTVLGALLGGMGSVAGMLFVTRAAQMVPLTLAAVFLAMSFGFDRNLPQPIFLQRLLRVLHARPGSGALLGMVTPLIPCGPLYLMFGVSLISGSWVRGGTLMLCFALGTLPLYWLAQWQWFHLSSRMSPASLRTSQKVLACTSAALVMWRMVANGGLGLAVTVCH